MTSETGKQMIENGWKSAGIIGAITKGLGAGEQVDPFDSIDPSVQQSDGISDQSECVIGPYQLEYFIIKSIDHDNDLDDEWEMEETGESTRNIISYAVSR